MYFNASVYFVRQISMWICGKYCSSILIVTYQRMHLQGKVTLIQSLQKINYCLKKKKYFYLMEFFINLY